MRSVWPGVAHRSARRAANVAFLGPENGENDIGGASPKRLAANRRNAMRSTGLRTPEGKRVSKFNATKDGLRAHEIMTPGPVSFVKSRGRRALHGAAILFSAAGY